ncbi:MAG TPA: DUF3617 domain-containing protein [Terriglobales bacterium]|nr:DUF3617 domain-containing protein [Terriglobales bacterium]
MSPFTRIVFWSVATVSLLLTVNAAAQTRDSESTQQSKAKIQLNVKPGLWEQTLNVKVSGEAPLPPEALSRLTPEQRARMEERMKANSAAHTRTTTEKHCLTEEELRKHEFLGSGEGKECTSTITTSTSTTAKGTISCETQGITMTGALEIIAPDPEHANGSWHATSNGGGHTMNVDSTFSSKWLGSSCGDVK